MGNLTTKNIFPEINKEGLLDLTGVYTVPDLKYYRNSLLKKIIIGPTVTHIGKSAFSRCINLNEINFSNSDNIIVLDERCFQYCHSLKVITFPFNLRFIKFNAVDRCTSLEVINFNYDEYHIYCPNSFRRCNNIKYIHFIHDDFEFISRECLIFLQEMVKNCPNVHIKVSKEFQNFLKEHIPNGRINEEEVDGFILK